MRVKVFTAAKLHKALALVRQEFGPDAVIMDRLEGVDADGKRIWHVHAALDEQSEPSEPVNTQSPAPASAVPVSDSSEMFRASMERLERIVEGLGRQEDATLREALTDHKLRQSFDYLVRIGIAPTHAFDMADDFLNRRAVSSPLLHWAERITPKKTATGMLLLGPSGAGKTTLIAKLATHYSLKGVRVALLTTDANRMGGTDVLKSYADILGVPFFVLRSIEDVQAAVEQTKSAQLLLVDSEGWNFQRSGGVRKQQKLWDAIPLTYRIMVMPVNMDEMDGMEMLAIAKDMNVKQLALTKIDETPRPGKLVNWAAASGMHLSYCSFGPDVPEKMGWLSPKSMTSLLASQESNDIRETA